MKKLLLIAVLTAVALAVSGCDTKIPIDGNSSTEPTSTLSQPPEQSSSAPEESLPDLSDESSEVDISYTQSVDDPPSADESSTSSDTVSQEISEPSSADAPSQEPSSEPQSSEPSSQPTQSEQSSEPQGQTEKIGKLFASYHNILKSGRYVLRTVESKIVGGEAMPYTTTVTHDGSAVYITIEESYGATSELLIKDGYTYWLDSVSMTALCAPGTESLSAERKLYADGITYLRNEVYKSYDTEYDCEVYTDSRGREFSFGFSMFGELRIYRFYDAEKKDTITIDISISAYDGEELSLPDGYTVAE